MQRVCRGERQAAPGIRGVPSRSATGGHEGRSSRAGSGWGCRQADDTGRCSDPRYSKFFFTANQSPVSRFSFAVAVVPPFLVILSSQTQFFDHFTFCFRTNYLFLNKVFVQLELNKLFYSEHCLDFGWTGINLFIV